VSTIDTPSPLSDLASTNFDPGIVTVGQICDLTPQPAAALWGSDGGSGVCCDGLARVRRFFRYAPCFIDDPDSVGLFHDLAEAIYHAPAPLIARFSNALMFGYRTVASAGLIYNDHIAISDAQLSLSIDTLGKTDELSNEDTGLRRIESTRHFWLDSGHRPTRTVDEPVISLCSTEPSNYGSFIFRVLPKVVTLEHHVWPPWKVLVYARSESAMRLLELAGIARDRIIQHEPGMTTRLSKIIVPSLRNPDSYLDLESRLFYDRLRDRFGAAPAGRRIYVSRHRHGQRAAGGRLMRNEAELIERLKRIGFDIVEPENLSAEDQIRVFSSASLVVGPSGSGMFNCVFCHPGTAVIDIESEPHWIYAHAGLFASCGLNYGLFVGRVAEDDPAAIHRQWSVNIDALLDRIAMIGN
jgi:hypothetical protein